MLNPANLPVYQQKERILEMLKLHQVIVIESPTGSGKTTQLPLILHEAGYSENGVIGVTQPRRIAALSVTEYINKQLDEILMFASPENAYKVSGQGTLHQVYIDVISDSVKLSKFGFQFDNTTRVLDPVYMSTKQKQK